MLLKGPFFWRHWASEPGVGQVKSPFELVDTSHSVVLFWIIGYILVILCVSSHELVWQNVLIQFIVMSWFYVLNGPFLKTLSIWARSGLSDEEFIWISLVECFDWVYYNELVLYGKVEILSMPLPQVSLTMTMQWQYPSLHLTTISK